MNMLEYLCPLQTRKRRSVEISPERPPKRARLTERNLKAFGNMGGRQRKSAGKKSTGQSSSTTTTTDKDFGTKLQQNNIAYTAFDARAADDVAEVRKLLDQPRASEPPDQLAYNRYLVLTEDYENELAVEISAYPLLSKRMAQREVSGYFQRPNHPWSAVDNHLTMGLSDAQPDIVESYRKTDYPPIVVEALSGDLAPSSYNEAMPVYAVEFKSSNGDMKEAKLQCAYDGALMTEGARAIHKYLDKSDNDFYGKTQALTVAFNGETLKFYGHHALQIPPSPQPAGGVDSSAKVAIGTVDTQYPLYLLAGDNPRDSFEDFQRAYKRTRNAEDIGYKWATERRDALWAYTNGDNTRSPPNAPTSAQQPPTDALVPVSSGPPDGYKCDASDEDSTNRLLKESWTSSTGDMVPMNNGYPSPDAQVYNPITPPQSSKDVSVPLESQQLFVSAVTEVRDDVDSIVGGRRTTRRTRTRAVEDVSISLDSQQLSTEVREDVDSIVGGRRTTRRTRTRAVEGVSISLESQQLSTEVREGFDSIVGGRRTRTRAVDNVNEPREIDHKPNVRKTLKRR